MLRKNRVKWSNNAILCQFDGMRTVLTKPHCVASSTPRSSGKDRIAADEAVNNREFTSEHIPRSLLRG